MLDPALPYSELRNCLSGEDYSEAAGIGAGLFRAEQPRVWELVAESLHIARPIVHREFIGYIIVISYNGCAWITVGRALIAFLNNIVNNAIKARILFTCHFV